MAHPDHFEQTIAEAVEFSGVGLHSGVQVSMRLLPAPGGSGIVFRRTDLENFEITAIGRQSTSVDLAAETYGSLIAAARTFGYKADEQRLRDMGLIRGAGPENAIILGKDGPENGPLRFTDEYVRHKVLDLIGDLALAGRRIEGHVVAERAGHAMHTALVSRLLKDRSAWELARVPTQSAADAEQAAPALRHSVLQGA